MNEKNPLTTIAGKVHECVPVDELSVMEKDALRYRAIRYGVLNNVEPSYTGSDVDDCDATPEEQMEDFDKVADSMVEKVVSLGVVA